MSKKGKDVWDGYVDKWLKCEGEGCGVYQMYNVKDDWNEERAGVFKCGLCSCKEMKELKEENARLENMDNENKKCAGPELERMKEVAKVGKKLGVLG